MKVRRELVIALVVVVAIAVILSVFSHRKRIWPDVSADWLTCNQDADCMAVPGIDTCMAGDCATFQINRAFNQKYEKRRLRKCGGGLISELRSPRECPEIVPRCIALKCGG